MTGLRSTIPPRARNSRSWAVKASGLKYTSYRAISSLSKGERPGPENSIGKLVSGMMLQDIATYAMDLQGAAGVLTGDGRRKTAHGQFQQMLLSSPSMRIAGGTDEILRNIIAERVLGLPGDIRVDKDVPFNKIPTKGREDGCRGKKRRSGAYANRRPHRRARRTAQRALFRPRLPAAGGAARDHRACPRPRRSARRHGATASPGRS